jgi:ABC-type branched-subunit amino acid transport system ATPase component/branched-subunit amino acid ABC-type transport system permease component
VNGGTLVLGVVNGLTIGLVAVGLVLVYRAHRFINLAQAQMGTVPALLLDKFGLDWHWNWWVAFSVAVAIGVVTGVLVERLFVRPMRQRHPSAMTMLLLSIGVAQLLFALTFVPALSPSAAAQGASLYPQPFVSHVRVASVVLPGTALLTVVLVPLIGLSLAGFLRYSLLGKQIRAAAANPDEARLCGVAIGRVNMVTWALAGGLSAVAAVLAAPSQPSFNVAALGPDILMFTLGAAAFGAFTSLSGALAGGVVVGLVDQITLSVTSNASEAELAVFGLTLLVLMVRGRALNRSFDVATTSAPARSRSQPDRGGDARLRRRRTAATLALAVVVPFVPYFDTEPHRFLLVLVLVYALLGVALTMLMGWGGQISLGHFALVGMGAYMTVRLAPHGWTIPALLVFSGLIGALAMVVVGIPALRVRGLTLAVTTLGLAVIAPDWLFTQGWFGSTEPVGVPVEPQPAVGAGLGAPHSELSLYFVALVLLVLVVLSASALRRSGAGRLMLAVRDNERGASAFGVFPPTVKLGLLALTGALAAAAGVIWAGAWRDVATSQFGSITSIAILAIPVIGGLGSLMGAVWAAAIVYGFAFFAGPAVAGLFGSFGQNLGFGLALGGAGLILTVLRFPHGLAGVVSTRRRLRSTAPDAPAALAEVLPARAGSPAAPADPAAPLPARAGAPAAPADPAAPSGMPSGSSGVRSGVRAALVRAVLGSVLGTGGGDEAAGRRALVASGLSVRFGGVVALDGAGLEVGEDEIVGLIGPNGAGKSTLLDVLSGVLPAGEGSIRLFGRELRQLAPDLRFAFGLGRSFQEATLFAGLSVIETIQVALWRRYRTGVVSGLVAAPWVRFNEEQCRQAASELVDRYGLSPWVDEPVATLSTGTRRICELAAQVAASPKVLLLDEPTAGIAQREAEEFGPLIRRVRAELGCAVLVVEHDMPMLMSLCDRIYAMHQGRMIAEGTPDEVRGDPAVIASYLGTDPRAIGRSGTGRGACAAAGPRRLPSE